MRKVIFLVLAVLVVSTAALTFASEFHGAWPYLPPPNGHFNTFVTNAILGASMYHDLLEQPMAMYYWASGTWEPLLATSWELDKDKAEFVVHLRKGVKFNDGSELTSQDVVDTFYVGYLMHWAVWRFIDKVEAVDKYTVKFHIATPAPKIVLERYILREKVRAHSVYGEYAKKIIDLLAQGKTRDSEEMKALRVEFEQFRPKTIVGAGPYMIDPNSITEAQLTLVKFPEYWDIKNIKFDKVVVYNGETPVVTPLVMSKEVDYATHGFPPATEMQFKQLGARILRPPIYSGPAIYFNDDIYPFNLKEVRQAIAYAINKDENAYVSLGQSAKRCVYMAGFSDNIVPLWLSEETRKKLNSYKYDPKKAEEILKSLGFKRDKDGVWVTDKGQRMEYELSVPAEFADWTAAAQNAADQLTKFGIKTVVRGVTYSQHPTEVRQGRFQMAIREWGAGHPHPHFAFYTNLVTYNYLSGFGPGQNFPLTQKTKVFGMVDLNELVTKSGEGWNEEEQKAAVEKLAVAFNELLPIVPLWERYGNNPAWDGIRVTNWPADDDPLYKNNPYADNFVVLMLLKGILEPVK